jgi:hypothetical protein
MLAREDDASPRRQIVNQIGIVDQGIKRVKRWREADSSRAKVRRFGMTRYEGSGSDRKLPAKADPSPTFAKGASGVRDDMSRRRLGFGGA